MNRNLNKLSDTTFDLLILGGGIHGAVLFWQAALCGLSVGLIEKDDFAQGTSSNSQKIIHGGLRYLQQLNFHRMRQSVVSRGLFMRIAPHMVHPMACFMPIYGHGLKGKELMWLGLRINDLTGFDRNDLSRKSKIIPNGKVLSKSETNRLIPHLDQRNLSGSIKWYDAFCSHTERLIVSLIRTACDKGAVAANYVKAVNVISNRYKIAGVKARDQLTGSEFDIQAKRVANCTGPWTSELLSTLNTNYKYPQDHVSGINIVVNKNFPFKGAVGLKSTEGSGRLYFVVPWRDMAIIGTAYSSYSGNPDKYRSSEKDCLQLIYGFNQAYPSAKLKIDDVTFVHNGLLPVNDTGNSSRGEKSISKKFRILDHKRDGLDGFISIIGVKYTTAGHVTLKALKCLFPEISIAAVNSRQSLSGGEIDDFPLFKKGIIRRWENEIDVEMLDQLSENYGTDTEDVLKMGGVKINEAPNQGASLLPVLKGQTLFAIRREMALKLSDVVLRRTDIGAWKRPEKDHLNQISHIMAGEQGWAEDQREAEIREVNGFYPSFIV